MSLSAELERALHYPLGDELPAPGRAISLAPGVKWMRMPLPFALDHINLWLLRDRFQGREGWTVVDCCIDRPESRALWEQVFEHELEGLPVVRVVVTHMHPDHIGLAHWLCERWQAPLWISATDFQAARYACEVVNSFGGDRWRRTSQPRHARRRRPGAGPQPQELLQRPVPAVPPTPRLIDGMQLTIGGQAWRCVAGYGHAPEHMALYRGAACGDGRGATAAGGAEHPDQRRHGAAAHLHQRQRVRDGARGRSADAVPGLHRPLRRCPKTRWCCPRTAAVPGLHTRIQQLHDHHRDRLAEVVQAAHARPVSAYDMLPVLFKRPLDLHQTTFALGESVAHLHRLWHGGQLARATPPASGALRRSDAAWISSASASAASSRSP
jgi:glyoxylase-like metal-dependent hydrolase (beta-lactamase superfamily II)